MGLKWTDGGLFSGFGNALKEVCDLFPSKFLTGRTVIGVVIGLPPGKKGKNAASLAEGLLRIGLRCTAAGAFSGFETKLT